MSGRGFGTFKTCVNLAIIEDKIKEAKIKMKTKLRKIEVVLEPEEYLKHIREIREQLKR